MHEFDSVSVSSLEAASLAATLTERSADGWDVVTVVPAGSELVAFLRRAIKDETAPEEPAETTTTAATAAASTAAAVASGATSPAAELLGAGAADDGSGWAASSATSSGYGAGAGGSTAGADHTATTSAWTGSSQQAAATQAAASPQVPAGWYADPAGRYELRYWDGGAWTEHVSRSGQQFTDPPIP